KYLRLFYQTEKKQAEMPYGCYSGFRKIRLSINIGVLSNLMNLMITQFQKL
ncbi:MAG: hypothetical protein ACJA2S_005675, partial [Cyclobacteriaceae bacterium]